MSLKTRDPKPSSRTLIVVAAATMALVALYQLDPRWLTPRASVESYGVEPEVEPRIETHSAAAAPSISPRLPAIAPSPASRATSADIPDWVAAERAEAADLASKEAQLALNTTPDHRARRETWAREKPDERWTSQMRDELAEKVRANVDGDVKVSHLSCRETICRMFLHFNTELDAYKFVATPYAASLDYLFQPLDPNYEVALAERSDHTHELMIKRPRPGSDQTAAERAKQPQPASASLLLGRKHDSPSLAMTE